MTARRRPARPAAAGPHVPDPLAIDWDRAGRWAGRLTPPGPTGTRDDLARLVDALRTAAHDARPLAVRASGLAGPLERSGGTDRHAQVLVVDRPGWARAAGASFAGLLPPVAGPSPEAAPATAQVAAVLGLLSARVLGQLDPFARSGPPGGRLLLVAPNVLRMQQQLGADVRDLTLWIAVHEQTHALQMAAAPWLVDHLRSEVAALVTELARQPDLLEVVQRVADGVVRVARGHEPAGLLTLALSAEQRRRVERVSAVMALLEGHADVTMDGLGRRTIPSVRRLRAGLEARRDQATGLDRLLRRLLGLDAKLAQYREGAAFVRGTRSLAGPAALDPAWTGPDGLPTPEEIADPGAWVRRVHG